MPALKRMIGDAAYGLRASQSHALLIGALVGLLGLTPGLRHQSAAPTDQAASKPAVAEKKKAAPELEPFDLSCVPAKAKSIMIFRPAAISRHRGMETSWEAVPLGPVLNLPVKGDEIEQVTSGFLPRSVPGRTMFRAGRIPGSGSFGRVTTWTGRRWSRIRARPNPASRPSG